LTTLKTGDEDTMKNENKKSALQQMVKALTAPLWGVVTLLPW
jgi:hypothetical protein